ncbi:calcium-binding protein [Rhizobium azibense]|uniref:Hemolysin type calcium-binding protein n=1 Tax=Rhizobium azibense TaxID=1136135 RepID=A0A4R3R9I0_9HYPH|nr:calcium-binding protein [Rhizobium azibense]TCU31411.1 hemolysin type calcium-binding protein [Rhizobium azibense]
MAVVNGGTTVPIRFDTLQVKKLFDYDFATVSSTTAKYYDNSTHYTLFQGSGFTFNADDVPTGGTITSVRYVINGSTALQIAGLSISATTFHSLASQNNAQGLLGLVLNGADTLTGTSLADVLRGYAGNDTLKGAGGKDVLDGGTGVDTALYTDKNGAVVVTLNGATNATVTVAGVAEDTVRNVENVTGGSSADTLIGDALANRLVGGAGNDKLMGAAGNDTIVGGVGKDVIDGGSGSDTVLYDDKAVAIALTLNGATNATVTVAGVAEDTIRNVEHVTGGSGADTLTGDGLANILNGGAGNDIIRGGGGADKLIGGRGNDFLNGNSGSDTVDYSKDAASGGTLGVIVNLLGNGSQGGLPADTAKDGFGNTDTVKNIPNVIGTQFNDQIYGGNHANTLSGGAGNDLINGGLGNDVMIGGAGNDTFIFNSVLGSTNIDKVGDFFIVNDTMRLENAIFTALSTGTLASAAFRANTTGLAGDSSDRVIYETDTGELYYDANGSAAGGGLHFATLTVGLALTNADFFVI